MTFSKQLRNHVLLSSSIAAISAFSGSAQAACTPDPTRDRGQTICSGTDTDGLTVPTSNTTVVVQADATVLSGVRPAAITLSGSSTVTVAGLVDGGSTSGILVSNGVPYYGWSDPYAGASPRPSVWGIIYPSVYATISVSEDAVVRGTTAIALAKRSDNPNGRVALSLNNAGTLTGTAGPAIVAGNDIVDTYVGNTATGFIGGISGPIDLLSNAGIIDGGIHGAFVTPQVSQIANEGTMRSASDAATISLDGGWIENLGTIENNGSGSALSSTGYLRISNADGGRITTTGQIAIATTGGLELENDGEIIGSIVATGPAGSTIDASSGSITGDILFGSGDDQFIGGDYDLVSGRFANVTGIVDGGEGIDTAAFVVAQDATLTGATMPLNFERFQLTLGDDARVELGDGFEMGYGTSVAGTGTLVIDRDATSNGPLLTGLYTYQSRVNLVTNGDLTATLSTPDAFAIDLQWFGTGENTGSVVATGGGGLRLITTDPADDANRFTNSGSIVADSTALLLSGELTNTGVIRSNDGIALINDSNRTSSRDLASGNTGTIEGRTGGIRLEEIGFTNSGTVTATAGIGVELGTYSSFDNLEGGVVSGTTLAIGGSTYLYEVVVRNAGTINGDVRLIAAGGYDRISADVFIDDGGILNGNLQLGAGNDYLITDLDRDGPLAGVSGTIDAGDGYDTFRYRVLRDSSLAITVPSSFEAIGYELVDGATIDLTAAGPQTLSVEIGGSGNATVSADLQQTDQTILNLAPRTSAQLAGDGAPDTAATGDLHVVSDGTLRLSTITGGYGYSPISAVAAGHAHFENAGTIVVQGTSTGWYRPVAISGLDDITNSGTISLSHAMGVNTQGTLINSGSILQTGSGRSAGVTVQSLENSGTISVDDVAVTAYAFTAGAAPSIVNGGLIQSGQSMAITANRTMIVNQSTGTIRGAEVAIYSDYGSTVVNAGRIVGDVLLGAAYANVPGSTYIADGGTLDGDLIFGNGNDVLLARNGVVNVTGRIDARGGQDVFGRYYVASTSAVIGGALPTNFEVDRVEAIGADTTVTLTGADVNARGLQVAGDGRIVNRANIAGSVVALADASVATDGIGMLSSFTNEATLRSGFRGMVGALINDGTITGDVQLGFAEAGLANHGTIVGNVALGAGDSRFDFYQGSSVSGTVQGGAGSNRLALHLADNGAPSPLDLALYQGFQQLSLESGVGALAGDIRFDRIDVDNGRLIGLAGSTITASQGIIVARNGAFGSAGTVNASLLINGTLTPGATGTMIVNGDVTMAAGSTALLDVNPTIGSAIVVNGGLAIGSGTTLRLIGSRPLTPGVRYGLITASAGITGRFSTIDQMSTVTGILRQTANAVELLGQFQLGSPANVQVTTTVDHVNGLIAAGSASSGLLAAFPALVDANGYANAAIFARLGPQAYASAQQLGIENGLALSTTLRSLAFDRSDAAKQWFGFGQVFSAWRRLPGDDASGISGANVRSTGALGGIGYRIDGLSIGMFVGHVDSRQSVRALGATTNADGIVAGVTARVGNENFDAGFAIAHDGSTADTSRPVVGDTVAKGHYSLRGWTADFATGYRFAIGDGWSLRPEIGFTHVESRRGRVTETGGAPYDLAVLSRTAKADFASGELTLGTDTNQRLKSRVSAGVRHQFGGKGAIATASFVGNSETFSLGGVARDATLATLAANVAFDLTPTSTVGIEGRGEFGADTRAGGGTVSLRIRF